MGKPTNVFKIKGSTTQREKLSPNYLDYKARIFSLVCLAKIKNSKGRDEVGGGGCHMCWRSWEQAPPAGEGMNTGSVIQMYSKVVLSSLPLLFTRPTAKVIQVKLTHGFSGILTLLRMVSSC